MLGPARPRTTSATHGVTGALQRAAGHAGTTQAPTHPPERQTIMSTIKLERPQLRTTLRLLVSTLKGGPGKTTTAWMTALALAARGWSVVVICADTGTQGLTDWYNMARAAGYTVPFIVLTWRGVDLDGPLSRFAAVAEAAHQPDAVLIDTGGEHPDVFMSAALYANRLVSPVGPYTAELRRMFATKRAAAEIDANKRDGLLMSVLLTRVPQAGKGRAFNARAFLAQEGEGLDLHVMETEIPRDLDTYEAVYGAVPVELGAYATLAGELAAEYAADDQDVAVPA